MQSATRRTLTRLTVRAFTMMYLTATIPSVAVAQAFAGPPGEPPQADRSCADQEAFFAARMAFLASKIEIKAEQRANWDAFVGAVRDAEKPMRELCGKEPPPLGGDALAALEARDQRDELLENLHKAMREAVARLKATLPADQQRRLAEALLAPPPPMRGPGFGPPPSPVGMAGWHPMERCGHPGGPPRPE